MYEYRVDRVVKVVDGDTVRVVVDLGCDVAVSLTLRLAGLDAPELPTDAGKAAKAWLAAQLDGPLTVRTIKDRREKYGRYLAELWREGATSSVNQLMLEAGMATPYDGGARV